MQTMLPHLIITRPAQAGAALAGKISNACGYDVPAILAPGLDVVPLDVSLPAHVDHLLFTSANAVAQVPRLGLATKAHAWCVGKRTAAAAKALGFDVTVGGGDAGQLLQLILDRRPEGQILHLSGVHTRGDIARTLGAAGLNCEEIAVYDQKVLRPTVELTSALSGDKPVVIPLFSARSGLILTAIEWRAPVHVIAISEHVADIVTDWGADTVQIAEQPDEISMITVTCRTLDRLKDGMSVT